MLRSRRVAKIRETKLYHVSSRWFARSPFYLVTLFNVLPIPVDVVRMLASVQRYPRLPFAAANFIGRFVRYGVIAWVTYRLGEQGKWVVVGLLGVAVVLAAVKVLPGGSAKNATGPGGFREMIPGDCYPRASDRV